MIHILSNYRPLPNHDDDDDDDDHDGDADHDDDDDQVNNGEQQSIADEIAAVNTSTNFSIFTLLRFGLLNCGLHIHHPDPQCAEFRERFSKE